MIIRSASAPFRADPARLCRRCLAQRRNITESHLARIARGRAQWDGWAKEIRGGKRKSMLSILEERGFVNDVAGDRVLVNDLMIDKRIGAYVGVDPTAPSLHIGHMIPFMALFWMHLHGFHTVSLIGASTAKIGDPTGRSTSRPKLSPTERKANLTNIHYQLKRIWMHLEGLGKKYGYTREENWLREIVNNATWWNKTPMQDVLRVMGSGLRMGTMLSRETVKQKMASTEGMSFAEFCYPVMQAWDWWYMYHTKGIQFQIGGSDQYGNIVAGMDAIKHIVKTSPDREVRVEGGVKPLDTPYGLTTPLLTTTAGQKFGKSEGNAIWLDAEMTSVFDLYGFFVRTADADVERYLKLFTFKPLQEIEKLVAQHQQDPSKRVAQHALAFDFVQLVHGQPMATAIAQQHAAVFQKPSISSILASTTTSPDFTPTPPNTDNLPGTPQPAEIPQDRYYSPGSQTRQTYQTPSLNPFARPVNHTNQPKTQTTLPKSLVYSQPFAKVLYSAGLVASRSEGHRLAVSQGAYVGSQSSDRAAMKDDLTFRPVTLAAPELTWKYVIRDHESGSMEREGEEGLLILRAGKWNVRVVRIVSDELFEQLGLDAPGWAERKAAMQADQAEDAGSAPVSAGRSAS